MCYRMNMSAALLVALMQIIIWSGGHVLAIEPGGNNVCSYECTESFYVIKTVNVNCGFDGWSRCSRFQTKIQYRLGVCYRCCYGWSAEEESSNCDLASCFSLSPGDCPNGGICVRPDFCACKNGTESPKCEDTNECWSNNGGCSESCVNTVGSYYCDCNAPKTLNPEKRSCSYQCFDQPVGKCANGGACVGPDTCDCPDGTTQPSCDDIDECEVENICEYECVNEPASYSCNCPTGYHVKEDRITCAPVCFSFTPGTCMYDHNCTAPDQCDCKDGFEEPHCNDKDECANRNWNECQQVCNNVMGSYTCDCHFGFRLADDGFSCDDVNECLESNGGCAAVCENVPGSFNCSCDDGYSLAVDLINCDDVDECALGTSRCDSLCENTIGSYTCSCDAGLGWSHDESVCKPLCFDELLGECPNQGTCRSPGVCDCQTGYQQPNCTDIDECEENNGGCEQFCHNEAGSFYCSCQKGYTLIVGENTCEDVDECSWLEPCDHDCVNNKGSYTCTCRDGFELTDTQTCTDVDECANDPCEQLCENTPGSFHCRCQPDFIMAADGSHCIELNLCSAEQDPLFDSCDPLCVETRPCRCDGRRQLHTDGKHCIDLCSTQPCKNGGKCMSNWGGGYRCDCWEAGYKGDNCETGVITMRSSMSVRVGEAHSVNIDAKPQELNFTLANDYPSIEVDPNPITIHGPSEFEVLAQERGYYNITFNITGKSADHFEKFRSLNVRADDVFSRLELRNKTLPVGCFWYRLAVDRTELWFSSTSHWHKSDNSSTIFTTGVVMLEHNSLSVPISSDGVEIIVIGNKHIVLTSLNLRAGDGMPLDNYKDVKCGELVLSDRDIVELGEARSIFRSLFVNLEKIVPYFIQLEPIEGDDKQVIPFKPQILFGDAVQRLDVCEGAPTLDDILYLVFNFKDPCLMTVLEEQFHVPEGDFCIVVDMLTDKGPTVSFMFSPAGGARFRKMSLLKTFESQTLLEFTYTGFSVSLMDQIPVPGSGQNLQFWNGANLFEYPFHEKATVWSRIYMERDFMEQDAGSDFKLSGTVGAYMSDVDPQEIFTHLFVIPQVVFLELLDFTAELGLKVFGKRKTFKILDVMRDHKEGLVAMGGDGDRVYCGPSANPPGGFARFALTWKLFQGTPIIEDLILGTEDELYFFYTFPEGSDKGRASESWHNVTKDWLNAIQVSTKSIQETILDFSLPASVSETVKGIIRVIRGRVETIYTEIEAAKSRTFASVPFADLTRLITQNIGAIQKEYKSLKDLLSIKLDKSLASLMQTLQPKVGELRELSLEVVQQLYSATSPFFPNLGTWGFKGTFSFTILGLTFTIDGEVVVSDEEVIPCPTRFSDFYEHLQGDKAIRVYGALSGHHLRPSLLPWGPLFWRFLSPTKGIGFELALSTTRFRFVARLNVRWSLFGIDVSGDLFVSSKGIFASVEANLWDLFRSRLTVGAEYSLTPADWAVWVQADFLPGGDDSFQGSLWDAVRKAAKKFGESADRRLKAAEMGLSLAQEKLSSSKARVEVAKQNMLKKKSLVNAAVAKLENTKQKLEKAKAPFKAVNKKLKEMETKINQMCTIRTCEKVCLRGLTIARRCPYRWFKIPCLVISSCAYRISSPKCVASNAICKVKRGLVYAGLKVAQAAVHVPMMAIDVAKGAVTAAQIIVDKSRVLFDAAAGLYDGAKLVLSGLESGARLAERAVASLRVSLSGGLVLLDAFIQNKLQSYIDFKQCGFKSSISVGDGFQITVYCEVNFMNSGWKKHRFVINFRNVLGSLWKLAKHYLNKAMSSMALGRRKRRQVERYTLSSLHTMYRRDANSSQDGVAIDTVTNFWESQCKSYAPSITFIRESLEVLLNISQKVYLDAYEAEDNSSAYFQQFDVQSHINAAAVQDVPSSIYAELDLSPQQVEEAVRNARMENDQVASAFAASVKEIEESQREQIQALKNYQIILLWKEEMWNYTSKTYAQIASCVGFEDCVNFALGDLASLMDSVDPSLVFAALKTLPLFERDIQSIMENDTQIVGEMPAISIRLLDDLKGIDASDIFCGLMPKITVHPNDTDAVRGKSVSLRCWAESAPAAEYRWFRNHVRLAAGNSSTLTLTNISQRLEGLYKCSAQNHIGQAESKEAFLNVHYPPAFGESLPTSIRLTEGQETSLSCNASADPVADVTWYSSGSMDIVSREVTLIMNDSSNTSALYKCVASNTHGEAESTEVVLVVQPSTPACPSISLQTKYTSVPFATKQDVAIHSDPPEADLSALFKTSIETVLEKMGHDAVVDINSMDETARSLEITISPGCHTLTTCTVPECDNIYNSMTNETTAAVKSRLMFVANESGLFAQRGKTYSVDANAVQVNELQPVCEKDFVSISPGICAEEEVSVSLAPPTDIRIEARGGERVVRWSPPIYAERFVKAYEVTLTSRSDGKSITVNVSSPDTFLLLDDRYELEEYHVHIRAFTASHKSEVGGAILDLGQIAGVMAPESAQDSTVGVAVGVSVAFCILLLALAIIGRRLYAKRQKKSMSVSSFASTVSTDAGSLGSGQEGRQPVREAWIPVIADDKVKLKRPTPWV